MPSVKNHTVNQYESSLERDLIYILELDERVVSYVEQPVTIDYEHEGQQRRYTPDFLVNYHPVAAQTGAAGKQPKPLLVEVKYRDTLREDWKLLKPKFMAAMRYADTQGWRFKLLTEREIRTPFLENARFLWQFLHPTVNINSSDVALIRHWIIELRQTTPTDLLEAASADWIKQAELLHVLWVMVAYRLVGCDLACKLTMNSDIWFDDERTRLILPHETI